MRRIADETWYLTRVGTRVRQKNRRAATLLVRAGSEFDDDELKKFPLDPSEREVKAIEAPPENKAVEEPTENKAGKKKR